MGIGKPDPEQGQKNQQVPKNCRSSSNESIPGSPHKIPDKETPDPVPQTGYVERGLSSLSRYFPALPEVGSFQSLLHRKPIQTGIPPEEPLRLTLRCNSVNSFPSQ